MDSQLVLYTGLELYNIPVEPNTDLQTIIVAIDAAVGSGSGNPDYSLFNLGCLRDDYDPIDTTQQFAEAISDFVCNLQSGISEFVDTTFTDFAAAVTGTLTNLQEPNLTYAPTVAGNVEFNIEDTDSINQVYPKLFSGLDAMIAQSDPSTADWASIGVDPAPVTMAEAANIFIAASLAIQPVLTELLELAPLNGPYDNTANCLDGGEEDNADQTIRLLTDYVCTLPTFDGDSVVWPCSLTPPDDSLQSAMQLIATYAGAQADVVVTGPGPGLLYTPGTGCSGATLGLDPDTEAFYLVKADDADNTGDYLFNKLVSTDETIEITINSGDGYNRVDLSANIVDRKVAVNQYDGKASYLVDKIPSSGGNWGLAMLSQASPDNSQLILTPTMNNPETFLLNSFQVILSDPELLSAFRAVMDATNGCLCASIGDLFVEPSIGDGLFILTWTPTGGTTTTQVAKYRNRGLSSWLTNNFDPPNVLDAVTDEVSALSLAYNTVYQFQIDSNCPGDVSHSNIFEAIMYQDQEIDVVVNGGNISVNQNPMMTVATIEYRLYNDTPIVVDTQVATGYNPQVTFGSQIPGDYSVQWRLGTLINGVALYSDDPSQEGDWYSYGPITIS